MNVVQAINQRYSCRNYSNQKVSTELIRNIVETAGNAPSAANKQAYRVFIIDQPTGLEKCHRIYNREWIKTAPVILLIGAYIPEGWTRYDGKNHSEIDVAILTDHITLLATNEGLASCWICHFNKELCIELFQIPESIEPIALLPLGFPTDTNIPQKKRRNSSEWIFINQL